MAMKLFALEELENETTSTVIETSPEEGEVANVEVEIQEEITQTEDQAEAIDEGIEAADQLEEVQEVVQKSVEEGEGLTEPAAEAIRIAVEAISARIGYNPKKLAGLRAVYASESFASPSSRLANTKIALEGITDFLKNLWEKIKAAFRRLIEKIKNFWDKYILGINKTKNALVELKNKVERTPEIGYNKEIEAEDLSDSVASKFEGHERVDNKVLEEEIKTAKSVLSEQNIAIIKEAGKNLDVEIIEKGKFHNFNAEIDGVFYKFEVKGNVDEDNFNIEIIPKKDLENRKFKVLYLADKSDLKRLINNTIDLLDYVIKNKDNLKKANEGIEKIIDINMDSIESTVLAEASRDKVGNVSKNTLQLLTKLNVIFNKESIGSIKIADKVIAYVNECLKIASKEGVLKERIRDSIKENKYNIKEEAEEVVNKIKNRKKGEIIDM